jgi:hypothetical protein
MHNTSENPCIIDLTSSRPAGFRALHLYFFIADTEVVKSHLMAQ